MNWEGGFFFFFFSALPALRGFRGGGRGTGLCQGGDKQHTTVEERCAGGGGGRGSGKAAVKFKTPCTAVDPHIRCCGLCKKNRGRLDLAPRGVARGGDSAKQLQVCHRNDTLSRKYWPPIYGVLNCFESMFFVDMHHTRALGVRLYRRSGAHHSAPQGYEV